MKRADFHRHVGDDNICLHIQGALQRARGLHQQDQMSRDAVAPMGQLSASGERA
jgi:hypothetical protein